MAPSTRKSIPYYIILFCLSVIGLSILYAFLWQESFKHGIITLPFLEGDLGFYLWEFLSVFISLLLFVYYLIKAVKSSYRNKFFILFLLFGVAAITGLFLLPFRWGITHTSGKYIDTESVSIKFATIVNWLKASIVLTMLFLFYQRYKFLRSVNNAATLS